MVFKLLIFITLEFNYKPLIVTWEAYSMLLVILDTVLIVHPHNTYSIVSSGVPAYPRRNPYAMITIPGVVHPRTTSQLTSFFSETNADTRTVCR